MNSEDKKTILRKKHAKICSRDIFVAKQKIAIEKFGEIFEDEMFFALELTLNRDLEKELNKEYNKRTNMN
ncbi:hypothetical protein [Peptostreptococcus equinus]|uniref:Uncharacterized protein n=1 Tax=Peptostreptococcus equinus TaxID=3003601 RepID=A0ABY7JPH2_9FIRM|nr:hypothetical protein [Peptostreptococcus sp. CBA3647]WAW14384.1 hypothetical protein O0R46_07190 [Peptostreptococcus sp. CBA3647]